MGLQKKAPLPSRLSGNKKTTTTIPANKNNTATLLNPNGTFNDSIFDLDELLAENKRRAEEEAAEARRQAEAEAAAEAQRKLDEEQAIIDEIEKEQRELENSITLFHPSTRYSEDYDRLMDCYRNLPHTLKNIEVRNMRSSYNLDLDLDDEDWEELELDADFEGVAIVAKRDGSEEIFLSLPMQKDFVDAINANTEKLKEKRDNLKANVHKYPKIEDYLAEYDKIIDEEREFLFGKNSIIDLFNEAKDKVIKELVSKKPNPKDKELKNDFKKLKNNLKLEVEFSDPIKVVTSIDYDENGITKVHRKSINTKLTLTLKYPKKSGGTPKKIYSKTFNLLDN
jgi:hypothetical protein